MYTYQSISDQEAQIILGPTFHKAQWMAGFSSAPLGIGRPAITFYRSTDGAMARAKGTGPIQKTYTLDIKKAEGGGVIQGYASCYGNLDLDGEIMDAGCFADSIRQNGGHVPVLWGHQRNAPVGWGVDAKEDAHGLFVTAQLMLDAEPGKLAYQFVKTGIATGGKPGLSIGFTTPPGGAYTGDRGVTRYRTADLREYSIVTFPSNLEACVTAAKSASNTFQDEFKLSGFVKHTEPNRIWISVDQDEEAMLRTIAHEVHHSAASQKADADTMAKWRRGSALYDQMERAADAHADVIYMKAFGGTPRAASHPLAVSHFAELEKSVREVEDLLAA